MRGAQGRGRARRAHEMPFGPRWLGPGRCEFRLWAPAARRVALCLQGRAPSRMSACGDGWFALAVGQARPGLRYAFRVDDGPALPDPASRSLPDGVAGASELTDPRAHRWRDVGWRGRPWHEAVLWEVHVGTFSAAGTFEGLRRRLGDLSALGVTGLQLMPVGAFAGRRNWGYDGVQPYAPHPAYGGPDALKRLVESAHQHGLMVLLDVVYNHFGPVGNVLHRIAPTFFDPTRPTPWGPALRLRGPGSRPVCDYFIHNALYWVEEFHLDGLRLDAVHAMGDRPPEDGAMPARSTPAAPCEAGHGGLVQEIAVALQRGPGRHRHVHLVLENDANEADRLQPRRHPHAPATRAQWNDDFHHAAHVLATGQREAWYGDYAHRDARDLGRAMARGFVFQGQPSVWRGGRPRGQPTTGLPSTAFVHFLQNHDQVGNRALGERLDRLTGPRQVHALTVCLLLAPPIPLLFMGQACAAVTPFLFFCDHGGGADGLAEAVAAGRREEFRHFAAFADPAAQARIPDPNALDTFLRSRLDPARCASPQGAAAWRRTQALLRLRRRWLVPRLAGARLGHAQLAVDGVLTVRWLLSGPSARRTHWVLQAHLPAATAPDATGRAPRPPGPMQARLVYATDPPGAGLPAWSARVWLAHGDA